MSLPRQQTQTAAAPKAKGGNECSVGMFPRGPAVVVVSYPATNVFTEPTVG
jgi:hypothetical protein